MNFEISIDIRGCTKVPDTCQNVAKMFELDAFDEAISDLDEGANDRRKIFANFVTACVNGNCPGRNPELMAEIQRQLDQRK